jgi:hypothetical protein
LAYQPPGNSTFLSQQTSQSNQPAVLFSQNKPAPAISHQPTEQAAGSIDSEVDMGGLVAMPRGVLQLAAKNSRLRIADTLAHRGFNCSTIFFIVRDMSTLLNFSFGVCTVCFTCGALLGRAQQRNRLPVDAFWRGEAE